MTLHQATTDRTSPERETEDFPWWLVAIVFVGIALAVLIAVNGVYTQVFTTVAKGIGITITVTLTAFGLAVVLGLGIALMGMSDHVLLRQAARCYIEVVRGIPIIVLLFYIAFVGTPGRDLLDCRLCLSGFDDRSITHPASGGKGDAVATRVRKSDSRPPGCHCIGY